MTTDVPKALLAGCPRSLRIKRRSAIATGSLVLLLSVTAVRSDPPHDTQSLVFLAGGNLWIVGSNGTGRRPLVRPKTGKVGFFTAARDAPYVAYDVRSINNEIPSASDIYLLDLRDGQERRLTRDGRSREPAISPDGTKVAFEKNDWTDPDWGCCGKGVWLLDLITGSEHRAVGTLPISPQHRRIYALALAHNPQVDGRFAFWFRDSRFTWLENGETLAFERNYGKEGHWLTYLLDRGGTVTEIAADLGPANEVVHGRGDQLLVRSMPEELWDEGFNACLDHLYIHKVTSGTFSRLPQGILGASLSPDGRYLLAIEGTCEEDGGLDASVPSYGIHLISLRTRRQMRLYTAPHETIIGSLAWEPRGSRASFVESSPSRSRLRILELPSGEVSTCIEDLAVREDPAPQWTIGALRRRPVADTGRAQRKH